MRKAGPILILLIGPVALAICFLPGLQVPDSTTSDGTWRTIETKLGLDLSGGLRVEYKAVPVEGKTPTSYSMDHSAASFVYDPQGRLRLYARYGAGVAPMVEDLKVLLKS